MSPEFLEGADLLAIHGQDPISGLQARFRCRQSRLNRADPCRDLLVGAEKQKKVGKYRKEQVESRPRGNNQRPFPRSLREKPALGLLWRKLVLRQLTCHFDVPAERQPGDPVLCLAFGEAEDARAKSNRKPQHLHIQRLGHDEVPKLVDKDENPQQQQRISDVLDEHASKPNLRAKALQGQGFPRKKFAYKKIRGVLNSSASSRSSKPPWPGMSFPES